jgi:hypothetical protein
MQRTQRHLSQISVATGGAAEAVAWLGRRLAWERRLAHLRRDALATLLVVPPRQGRAIRDPVHDAAHEQAC